MSTNNQESSMKKKLILIALILLLTGTVIVGIIIFLKDSGDASATKDLNIGQASETYVNKQDLSQTIEEASGLIRTDYTEESWNALLEALTAGRNVNDNKTATQEQIDNAIKEIKNMISRLQKVDNTSNVTEETGEESSNVATGANNGSSNTTGGTGNTQNQENKPSQPSEPEKDITAPVIMVNSNIIEKGVTIVYINKDENALIEFNEGTGLYGLNAKFENLASGTTLTKEGRYTIVVTDVSGNATILTVVLDRTPSNVTITSHGNDEKVNGKITLKGTYADANPLKYVRIGLFGKDNIQIGEWIEGEFEASANAGTWTSKKPIDTAKLSVEGYIVKVETKDYSDNIGSEQITIIVDRPVIVTSHKDNQKVKGSITLEGKYNNNNYPLKAVRIGLFSENGSTPIDGWLKTIDNPIATGIISSTFDTDKLVEGKYIIKIEAEDKHGNLKNDQITIIVDKTPASVKMSSDKNNQTVKGTITVKGTYSDENYPILNAVMWLYKADGKTLVNKLTRIDGATEAGELSAEIDTTKLEDGEYIVRIQSTDEVGNYSTDEIKIIVDNTPTDVKITSHKNNEKVKGTITVKGTYKDKESSYPILNVVMWLYEEDGKTLVKKLAKINGATGPGTLTADIDTDALPEGKYVVRIETTDKAGNWNGSQVTIIVDRTPTVLRIEVSEKSSEGIITLNGIYSDENYPILNVVMWLFEEDRKTLVKKLAKINGATGPGALTATIDTTELTPGKNYVVKIETTDEVGNYAGKEITITM